MNLDFLGRWGRRSRGSPQEGPDELATTKAELAATQRKLKAAQDRATTAVDGYKETKMREAIARVDGLSKKGHAHRDAGEYDQALLAYTEILGICIAYGGLPGQARATAWIARLYELQDDWRRAILFRKRALELIGKAAKPAEGEVERFRQNLAYAQNMRSALTHRQQGYDAWYADEYETARQEYVKAIERAKAAGNQRLVADILQDACWTYSSEGKWQEGLKPLRLALVVAEKHLDPDDQLTAEIRGNIEYFTDEAMVKPIWDQVKVADKLYDKARYGECEVKMDLALADARKRKIPETHFIIGVCHHWLGLAREMQGQSRAGLEMYQLAWGIFRECTHRKAQDWEGYAKVAIARCVEDIGILLGYTIRIQDVGPPPDEPQEGKK